jgi:hypothetical protein
MNLDCGALVTSTDATATATRIFFPPHLRLIGFAGLNINLDRPLSSCARHHHRDSGKKFFFSHLRFIGCAGRNMNLDRGGFVTSTDATATATRIFFPTSSAHRFCWPEHQPGSPPVVMCAPPPPRQR